VVREEFNDRKVEGLDELIDLRSDTVTRPTPEMRAAMAAAEVGDDVYGEDPTVNRLEERAAEIFGREAALFVPTGTMGNQIGIRLHTQPGQEVIAESRAHILDWEIAFRQPRIRVFEAEPDRVRTRVGGGRRRDRGYIR
jgi:tryptophanase